MFKYCEVLEVPKCVTQRRREQKGTNHYEKHCYTDRVTVMTQNSS